MWHSVAHSPQGHRLQAGKETLALRGPSHGACGLMDGGPRCHIAFRG